MKKKYIYANWKSNKNIIQARSWVSTFIANLKPETLDSMRAGNIEVGIFPPMPLIQAVSDLVKNQTGIVVGSQDISEKSSGKYTGLVSGESLAGIATHVLVGHAEMREYSDNQDKVEAKYKRASEYLLSPVLCIRKSDEMISGAKIVAYEPIYAIGTGVVASADEIGSMKDEIKNISDCIFLYGGSVAKENIHSLLTSNVCDGFLIGGASLDPVGFAELVNISA